MREFVNAANVASSASLAAGLVALMLTVEGRLHAAAAAVLVAALLDAVAGSLARRLSKPGRFGCHLDSLSDLVAFGVAPALMLHRSGIDAAPLAGALVAVVFVVAGAWRLARFQLAPSSHRLEGLPIPLAGLALVVAALTLPAAAALAAGVALAVLMVSSVPVPTMDTLGRFVQGRRAGAARGAGAGGRPLGLRRRDGEGARHGAHQRARARARRLVPPVRRRTRP